MIYKTWKRLSNTNPTKTGSDPEEYSVPASQVAPVVSPLLKTRDENMTGLSFQNKRDNLICRTSMFEIRLECNANSYFQAYNFDNIQVLLLTFLIIRWNGRQYNYLNNIYAPGFSLEMEWWVGSSKYYYFKSNVLLCYKYHRTSINKDIILAWQDIINTSIHSITHHTYLSERKTYYYLFSPHCYLLDQFDWINLL